MLNKKISFKTLPLLSFGQLIIPYVDSEQMANSQLNCKTNGTDRTVRYKPKRQLVVVTIGTEMYKKVDEEENAPLVESATNLPALPTEYLVKEAIQISTKKASLCKHSLNSYYFLDG